MQPKVDDGAPPLHALAMRFVFALLFSALLVAALAAQQVALPHATGTLTPPAGWVALRGAELTASERASDPAAEPGRTLLRELLATMTKAAAPDDHVVLHGPGDGAGHVRIVDAYSDASAATAAHLQRPETIAAMRDALLASLREEKVEATYEGGEPTSLCGVGGVRLRFSLQRDGKRWLLHHHAMPARSRVQYFEALLLPDDAGGAAAVDGVLRTFDGAFDAPPTTLALLLVGVVGGALGVLMGLWRRRRLMQKGWRQTT